MAPAAAAITAGMTVAAPRAETSVAMITRTATMAIATDVAMTDVAIAATIATTIDRSIDA